MTIVFDNNIMLDALLERRPFCDNAGKLMVACVDGHFGCLTANSLTDIFYVLSKSIGAVKAKLAVRKLIELFEILPVSDEDCIKALDSSMDDFEDALVSVCAHKRRADYIVSRDVKFIGADGPVPVIEPGELLKMLG